MCGSTISLALKINRGYIRQDTTVLTCLVVAIIVCDAELLAFVSKSYYCILDSTISFDNKVNSHLLSDRKSLELGSLLN